MYSFKSMNTTISTFYISEEKHSLVQSWFLYAENIFSRFLPNSELSQFNRSKGHLFLPTSILYDVLKTSDDFYKETEGLFNPYLCEIICDLGYDRSFEMLGLQEVMKGDKEFVIPMNPIIFDESMKGLKLIDASIDLGGIAKGWTAQQIANQLQASGELLGAISAGGDIFLWGERQNGWDITIAHPRYTNKDLFSLKVIREAGVATSSTLKRSWKTTKGDTKHHIIDPRSHNSSGSDLIQVTILANDLTTAEVYAKCLLILGWDDGIKWLNRKKPTLAAIGIKRDLSIHVGGAMETYCLEGVKKVESTIC
ncbi:FAD:protein FMN transferase [Bacillus sp. FJAT-49736]|uniref:FAD:protein FMN transferase n=1 Tax=Bacillus sp. FJAT-49736 TaxID=2833582 RepID=UPI001BCA389A|nr:FAD:protein FMN transferase [Bacillus sp. FJAT-49736]MBS4174015.1 FAD:protein FMN transferase [Bacillus sp. FJAT-49736]